MFKDRPIGGSPRGVPPRRLRHARLADRQGRRDPRARGPHHGFSPRGAVVETGSPAFPYTETERDRVWANNVASLYEQATAAQWDASIDIRWHDLRPLPTHVERAVCQIMTHLAENEYAALYVPAQFIPRIHPHFTEVGAVPGHAGDATRPDTSRRSRSAPWRDGGGSPILDGAHAVLAQSLLDRRTSPRHRSCCPSSGEGAFLEYLAFVERFAPEPVTADIVRRARDRRGAPCRLRRRACTPFPRARRSRSSRGVYDSVRRRAAFLADASAASPHVEEALARAGGRGGPGGARSRTVFAAARANRTRPCIAAVLGVCASSASQCCGRRALGAPHGELHVRRTRHRTAVERAASR